MKRIILVSAILLSGLALVPRALGQSKPAPDKDGWLHLLEGKDLGKHWTTKGNWALGDDGVLTFTPAKEKERGPFDPEQHLWSKLPWQDFEIEFDFNLGKKPDRVHGAFVFHVPDKKNYLRQGSRVLIGAAGARPVPSQLGRVEVGSIPASDPFFYPALALKEDWNTMRVRVNENDTTVLVNGELIGRVRGNHAVFASQPETGLLGFERFGVPLSLRNIRLRKIAVPLLGLKPDLPDGTLATIRRGQPMAWADQERILVWSAAGEVVRAWPIPRQSVPPLPALSPDGKKVLALIRRDAFLFDVDTGIVQKLALPPVNNGRLNALFSSDSRKVLLLSNGPEYAAVCETGTGRITHLHVINIKDIAPVFNPNARHVLSPDGRHLCVVRSDKTETPGVIYDLAVNNGDKPLDFTAPRPLEGWTTVRKEGTAIVPWPIRLGAAWAPDGSRFATWEVWATKQVGNYRVYEWEIRLWQPDGKPEKTADGKSQRHFALPAWGSTALPASAWGGPPAFVDAGHLLLLSAIVPGEQGFDAKKDNKKMVLLDLATGKAEPRDQPPEAQVLTVGKLNPSRSVRWGADGREIGWCSAPVWSKEAKPGKKQPPPVFGGLNLATLDLLRPDQVSGFELVPQRPKDWKMEDIPWLKNENQIQADWIIARGPESKYRIIKPSVAGMLVYDGKFGRLSYLPLSDEPIVSFALAPDRRTAMVAFQQKPGIHAYRIDLKEPAHLLSIYGAGSDWVAWTPLGYYAATPGGERLIGVLKRELGLLGPLTFYPIDRFRAKLHRPDIIKLVLEKGSVEEAVKAANSAANIVATGEVTIDDLLPPRAVLTLVHRDKASVKLKAEAEAAVKDQPVTALRLLVDGRPLADGAARLTFAAGKPKAAAEWTVTLPPGKHLLTVLARSPDASSKSNNIEVDVVDPTKQHALHVLAIGINDYEDSTLKLEFAAKDAQDIATNFEKCKGELFHEARAEALVNGKARKDIILKQLAEVRKQVKPNDLAVIFFAGHGVKEKDKFYLLPMEAKTADLARTAISGEELRKALSEFPCQVLLMLDACHSSAGLKNFRPAVDDITRNLTDDDCGVAVLCAAMAHEKALEKDGNGLFTRAIVDGLNRGEGVPYNTFNRLMYVHHLHSYVFDRVSHQSGDRQHPFLSLPWVVESFPVAKFTMKQPP